MPKSTAKLKIGFVIDDGLDKPDGVQQYVLTLGKWLSGQGHEVRYLTGETKRSDIASIISLSKNLKVRFNANSLSSPLPASTKKIKEVLIKENFDVLHIQMPYSPFLAAKVIKHCPPKVNIIGTFHILPIGKVQHAGTRLLGLFLKRNLKRFDTFLSVSEPARKFAKQTFGIDSEVVPNPVDIARFKTKAKHVPNKTMDIVYLGRLVPRKGCMQLIQAAEILLQDKTLPPIKLHICGEGRLRQSIEHYVANSPALRESVVMHGFVSEDEKVKFLNRADFAVFPSLGGESFGIVLIEAMAAGSGVVLAGNNPGYASVMQGMDECLFDATDPTKLKNMLQELINNPKKAASVHKAQQKLVPKYDISEVGARLLKKYTA